MNLTCAKCKEVKDENEFYNSKTRKTGKQPNCKLCNKEYRKYWYNEVNPKYFWGKEGYFTRRYAEQLQYQLDYRRADKSCKIYKLTLEDGSIYIGFTKRNIVVRMIEHRRCFNQFLRGSTNKTTRLSLYYYFVDNNYTSEQIKNVWESVEVLEEFDGTRYLGLKKEKETIQKYEQLGYKLVNCHHTTKNKV